MGTSPPNRMACDAAGDAAVPGCFRVAGYQVDGVVAEFIRAEHQFPTM
ncbi:hypothetical protein [Actinokineospora inagensis]|nr:hypothetical protein [Actinokineospora inagensis]